MDAVSMYNTALTLYTRLNTTDDPEIRASVQEKIDRLHSEYIKTQKENEYTNQGYPEISDPQFAKKILAKQEFALETKGKPGVCGSDFALSNPQKFIKNFLSPYTPYNGLLLFHGVGVGKTCAAIQVVDSFKSVYSKRVLVVAAPSLQMSFQRQLYNPSRGDNQCTTVSTINDFEFIGYTKLGNDMEDTNIQNIKEKFSNRLIIVDEAQNLRNEQNKNKSIAGALELIMTHATGVKLLLLTATPIFNDIGELRLFMELLYTNDKQFELVKKIRDMNFETLNVDEVDMLAAFSSRYVSYVRGENPHTFPERLWPKDVGAYPKHTTYATNQNESDSTVVTTPVRFSKLVFVDECPLLASVRYDTDTGPEIDTETNFAPMQSTNIVYPGGGVGRDGFNSQFGLKKTKGDRVVYYYKGRDEFMHKSSVARVAPKIAKIIENIMTCNGIVLVYSQFIPSGVLPMAFALEHMGFTNFRSNLLECKKVEPSNGMRYAIIAGQPEISNNVERVVAAVNDVANNSRGEKLKVILFTRSGSEGLDYKCAREIHIMEPWFNMSRIEQTIGRGVRNCSHSALPEHERNCTMFLYATRLKGNMEGFDAYVYRLAEQKQIHISKIERIIKENALDCDMNETKFTTGPNTITITNSKGQRLKITRGDKDYTRLCDYMKCDMVCKNKAAGKNTVIDTSTFTEFFVSTDVNMYIRLIKALFINVPSATYEEVRAYVQENVQLKEVILFHALNKLVSGRITLNGNTGYIVYRSNMYIFQPKDVSLIATKMERTQGAQRGDMIVKLRERSTPTNTNINILQTLDDKVHALLSANAYPKDFVIDHVVDMLNEEQFLSLLRKLQSGSASVELNKYKKSMERGFVMTKSDNGVVHYYNYFQKVYIDGNDLMKVDEFGIKAVRMGHKLSVRNYVGDVQRKGFIVVKKGLPQFKIIDQKEKKVDSLQGVVCVSYPQMKNGVLRNMVTSMQPKWDVPSGKFGACVAYEIALRSLNDRSFHRPVVTAMLF